MSAGQQPIVTGYSRVIADSFFEYTNLFSFVTGSENFNVQIQIDSDGDFICTNTMYENNLEVGASGGVKIINGGALVTLTDGGSQRQLSNAQVPVRSLFGDSRLPYIWPIQHCFWARTFIGISITGVGATQANSQIRLTFSGYKRPPQTR